MTMMRLAFVLCAFVIWPGVVRAYSDPNNFSAPVLEAGGGGRFYTGSPAEGFGCDNCHSGGAAPAVKVEGLPARYVPRATYEFRVSWSHELEHAAAALELTDAQGAGVGSLALPAIGTYEPDESCDPKSDGILAAQLYAADRGRTVAAAPDCGAFMLRVQWTAPEHEVGPIWLAGSVLASNHDDNFSGDGSASFARTIPAYGGSKPDVVTSGGCNVAAGSRGGSPWALLLLVVLVLPRRRLWAVLFALTVSCEVHDTLWNEDSHVTVTQGSAVAAWSDAQVLAPASDAALDAGTTDAAVHDAGRIDDAVSDAGEDLDAGADKPDAAAESDSGQRCTFRVTTLSLGGRYSPRNIGAIWIERSDGTWVKTLERWAGVRLRYLTNYRAANTTGNSVDAVTSVTLSTFRSHNLGWNLAGVDGQEVANGDYRVQVEVTDDDKTGELLTVPFKKTKPPFEASIPDKDHFHDVQLRCR